MVVQQLRQELSVIPGLLVYPQQPPPIRIGGQQTKALYQFSLFGSDLTELYRVARDVEAKFRALPQLVDVNTDLQITSPQVRVDIQRDRAAALGITPEQIEDALYGAFGTRQVSTIYTPTNQYYVIMEVAPQFQRDQRRFRSSTCQRATASSCRSTPWRRCGPTWVRSPSTILARCRR